MAYSGECVIFDGYINKDGYGQTGSMKYAHREAWKSLVGPIPEGLCVRHKCDNPPCINVDHLELGTHADNMRDRSARDRSASVLSREDVRQVRCLLSLGLTGRWLAKIFGVSTATISMIGSGKRWSHV